MEVANGDQKLPLDETKEFVSAAARNASVYLCYAPGDQQRAKHICDVFEQRGMACWFSARDVKPSLPWPDCVTEAIESSPFFVFLLTKAASQSEDVLPEIQRAHDSGRSIIVLSIGGPSLSPSMEYQLSMAHWVSAADAVIDDDIESVWAKIIELETGGTINDDGSLDVEPGLVDSVSAQSILVQLTALRGKISGKTTYKLGERERLLIGRGPEVDIDVADTRVSRRHAGLTVKRDPIYGLELRVIDLMSTNGTWVRYSRDGDAEFSQFLEHGEARVTSGAIVRVGSTDIRIIATPIPANLIHLSR